jgi:NAD(P)H-flavin reductase
MATARLARVVAAQSFGDATRMLELVPDEPLGFHGGQYVIVDTGKTLPSGKACKRAYSVLSCDGAQDHFRIAVKRIPGGMASSHLHELELGATVQFSGPWGKLAPAAGADGRTLVLATDTGITAALGLVQSARFRPLAPATLFVWLEPAGDRFPPASSFARCCRATSARSASVSWRPSATRRASRRRARSCASSSTLARWRRPSSPATGS